MLPLVTVLLSGYEILVIVVVLGSWLPGVYAQRWHQFTRRAVEPILKGLRGVLPIRGGAVDFSPFLLIFLVEVLRRSLNGWVGTP